MDPSKRPRLSPSHLNLDITDYVHNGPSTTSWDDGHSSNNALVVATLRRHGIDEPPAALLKALEAMPAESRFELGALAPCTYYGRPLDRTISASGGSGFSGFSMLVVHPERTESKRVMPASNQIATQSLQSSFHLALCSAPPVWSASQLESGYAIVALLSQKPDEDGAVVDSQWHYEGLVEPEASCAVSLSLAYGKKQKGRKLFWSCKDGKDAKQSKDYPVPMVIRRVPGRQGSARVVYRLVISLYTTYNNTQLLDSRLQPCVTVTNPFRWVSKSRGPETETQAIVPRGEDSAGEEEPTNTGPDSEDNAESAFSMAALQRMMDGLEEEHFHKIVMARKRTRARRCALYGLCAPEGTTPPNAVPLEVFRGQTELWERGIRAVAHFIGTLQHKGQPWAAEPAAMICRNLKGCWARWNEITSDGWEETKAWLRGLEQDGTIPEHPDCTETRLRSEQLYSLFTGDPTLRVHPISTLRDIYPGSIVVDADDPTRIHHLASHDVDTAIFYEDQTVLLARVAHTARIDLDDCPRLLLTPYAAGLNGLPLDDQSQMLPPDVLRRFYLNLHGQFVDFHLYHIVFRNAASVGRFRRALVEQDRLLQKQESQHFGPEGSPRYITAWSWNAISESEGLER
ncbi:unnamed protein product [Jaminaea pallidilutea]